MAKSMVERSKRWGRGRVAVLLLATTAVSGCAVSDVPIFANNPNFDVNSRWASYLAENPGMVDNGWIHSFGDPRLVEFVNEALSNNRDLRASAAVLEESRARAVKAGAALVPTVSGAANVSATDNLDSSASRADAGSLSLSVSWEADLWGRIRNGKAAAALDAVAQSAAFEAARHSLAAAVADTWFLVNGNAELLEVSRSELRVQRNALRLVQERVDAGQILSVDANISRANVAGSEAAVIAAEGALIESIRALEVLLGRYPAGKIKPTGFVGGVAHSVPKGLPVDLLERRPDLVAADRRVAAAFFRSEAAKVARLPSLTLTGSLDGSGQSLGDALEGGNIFWTLASGLFVPIIDGRSRQQDVVIANAQQKQALEGYASAALNAFREVEDAITSEQVLARQAAATQTQLSQQRQALDIEQQRYDAGEIEIDRVDTARLRFFAARRALVSIRVAQLRQRVALHLALGGSFESISTDLGPGG